MMPLGLVYFVLLLIIAAELGVIMFITNGGII